MPQDKFFIAPYDRESGLNTSYKPWLIPDEAFSELSNAYVFRGRVRKRFGSRYFGVTQQESRLRVNLGNTNGSGNISTTTPGGGTPIVTPAIGQMFSIGMQVFTVYQTGTPAAMLISGTATLATFNTTTGAVVINGAAATTALYYYPALPVMGLLTFDTSSLENEMTIGFDQNFAYQYNNGWERLSTESDSGASVWSGSDSQFFWGTNWIGSDASNNLFFVTNFNQNEPNFMRYLDSSLSWHNFRPEISATGPTYLNSTLILLPFHDRLVALNTWEGTSSPGSNYRQRARYSAPGSPIGMNQWLGDVGFQGGAIDASTTESIVSAEFIKDRLIVFFERSTWEIVFTGNNIKPFQWQQINTELGAESTFSIIPFDKVAIGVGNVGIHACNGANVERIDESIPQSVFQVHNADAGITRVYGIRDYFVEMLYWTFPSTTASTGFPYPNRVLVYNYQKDTWAFNDDTITVFGYFQEPTSNTTGDNTWASTTITWDDEVPWNSGEIQPLFRRVVAGNQEGFTFMVDADIPVNASVIQITNISVASGNVITLNCINHNMRDGEYIYITGIVGSGNLTLLNNQIYSVQVPLSMSAPDPNNIMIVYTQTTDTISGTYKGGGTYARVSNINIKTKEFNFYAKQARNFGVTRVDFMVDKTSTGQIQVDYYVATNDQSMVGDSQATQAILGSNTLDTFAYPDIPFESTSMRIWHPVYFQGSGEVVQFQLTMNNEQITNVMNNGGMITGPSFVDFQMHAMCIYATPTNYGFR